VTSRKVLISPETGDSIIILPRRNPQKAPDDLAVSGPFEASIQKIELKEFKGPNPLPVKALTPPCPQLLYPFISET
jgi:hypothetical protein